MLHRQNDSVDKTYGQVDSPLQPGGVRLIG
jgi:hypothetical protein